jgi:hypothetical protein
MTQGYVKIAVCNRTVAESAVVDQQRYRPPTTDDRRDLESQRATSDHFMIVESSQGALDTRAVTWASHDVS